MALPECRHNAPELLAPAGGMEQLAAAVLYGADAVYLATDRFGMRARATNFSLEELPCAVQMAHAAGVRVYAACNILMSGEDIAKLPAYYEALAAAGVDAVIVGDLGAASLAVKYAPRMALHVSTQASVANAEAARVWHELGARRVVCAREMSLEEIAQMRADTPPELEIEAFVHGAQCMAVSGRCLISSYLTGRSGNKGNCTQPCRWNYALEEEKRPGEFFPVEEDAHGTFIMNAKDLNMLAYVRELAAAGVSSLKIEGRNKKAFYVATVVNAYRRVIDGASPAEVAPELETVSHRPYSTGFYFGEASQAPYYDGYEQTCLHAADVLACDLSDELMSDGEAALRAREGVFDGGDTFDASGAVSSQGSSAGGRSWQVEVRCRNRFAEGDELEVLAPGCEAFSVIVRNLVWLPDLDPAAQDGSAVQDALAPAPHPVPVAVANRSAARYRFTVYADELKGVSSALQTADDAPCAPCAPCASNVPSGSRVPLAPGWFLRSRQFRRSARH